jgi:hypothetical protein
MDRNDEPLLGDMQNALTHTIYVVFLRMDENAMKHARNRIASSYTGSDWMHCELYFPESRETITIDTKNPVYSMKNKDYFQRPWSFVGVKVDQATYREVHRWCLGTVGDPFDTCGFFFFWCPNGFLYRPQSGSWICSKLCTTALQRGHIISPDIEASTVSPGDLRGILEKMIPTHRVFLVENIADVLVSPRHRTTGLSREIEPETHEYTTDKRSLFYDETVENEERLKAIMDQFAQIDTRSSIIKF